MWRLSLNPCLTSRPSWCRKPQRPRAWVGVHHSWCSPPLSSTLGGRGAGVLVEGTAGSPLLASGSHERRRGHAVPLLSCCDLTLSSLARSFPSTLFLTFAGLANIHSTNSHLKCLCSGQVLGRSGPGKGQNWTVIRSPIPYPFLEWRQDRKKGQNSTRHPRRGGIKVRASTHS